MLKALLIDDEFNNLESLHFLLLNDCEDITVVELINIFDH